MSSDKPVLVLLDDRLYGNVADDAKYHKHRTTQAVLQTLRRLNVPYEIGWAGKLQDAGEDGSSYGLIVIPEGYYFRESNTEVGPWMTGSKNAPVFVAYARTVTNDSYGTSGATALQTHSTSSRTFISQWGDIGYSAYNHRTYTLDAADSAVTNLIYDETGNSAFWKRRGSAGHDVYFWGHRWEPHAALLYVLAQVYNGKYSYPLFLGIDHPEDADTAEGRANLLPLIRLFRSRGAVISCGIKTDTWSTRSAEMKALIRDNQDVLVCHPHSHGNTEQLWWDDDTWPYGGNTNAFNTVASKVAEWNRQKAVLEADGIKVPSGAELGYVILPTDRISMRGIAAFAKLGIPAWRMGRYPSAPSHQFTGGQLHWVQHIFEVDGEQRRVAGVPLFSGVKKYDANDYAEEFALLNLSADKTTAMIQYRALIQSYNMMTVLEQGAPIMWFHGTNLTEDAAIPGEPIGKLFVDVMDVIVRMCSPALRWAKREDLTNIGDMFQRRRM